MEEIIKTIADYGIMKTKKQFEKRKAMTSEWGNASIPLDALVSWICARPSTISGIGCFASTDIKQGTEFYYKTPILNYATYLLLSKALPDKEKELFLTTKKYAYDLRGTTLQYLNHSNEPNLDWDDGLFLIALRDILSGEEITINYGWENYKWCKGTKSN